jgi:hypothetical protein
VCEVWADGLAGEWVRGVYEAYEVKKNRKITVFYKNIFILFYIYDVITWGGEKALLITTHEGGERE